MSLLATCFGVCALVSLATLLTAYISVLWHLFKRPVDAVEFPVSILKPLKGVDDGLLENLRAIAAQEHHQFEILFGAEREDDPALDLARQVQAEFPHVPMRILVGSEATGLNPKVRILRHLLPHSAHDWILVSDSNVRPDPQYLRAMQGKQRKHDADLVHSVLQGVHGRSLGGRLEELQLNGWVAASICFSDSCGHSCVIGKSMLLRRSALSDVGGLADVADILAEDYILGSRLQAAGKKVVLSPHTLPVVTGDSDLAYFFNRHVRWGQMRRRIAPFFFFAELSANPTPFLLGLWLLSSGTVATGAVVAQCVKWAADAFIYLRLSQRPSAKTLALMPLKDVLVLLMWCISCVRKTVNWRGNVMLVGPGSRLYPLDRADEMTRDEAALRKRAHRERAQSRSDEQNSRLQSMQTR